MKVVTRTLGSLHTWVYQKSEGRIGSHFTGGAPVMLLTTRGRCDPGAEGQVLAAADRGVSAVPELSGAHRSRHPGGDPEARVERREQRQQRIARLIETGRV